VLRVPWGALVYFAYRLPALSSGDVPFFQLLRLMSHVIDVRRIHVLAMVNDETVMNTKAFSLLFLAMAALLAAPSGAAPLGTVFSFQGHLADSGSPATGTNELQFSLLDAATGGNQVVNGPRGIAVSGANLFVVNNGSGTVGEYTTSGATVNATLVSGLSIPYGIAVLEETGSVPAMVLRPFTSSSTGFTFNFGSVINQRYQIQASTDLTTWVDLTNGVVTRPTMQVVDPMATNFSRRFYRVVSP